VEYFHPRVRAAIESWPVDVLADYARLVELLIEHGPRLRLPHSRALGGGLFELRPRGRSGIGRAFLLLSARRTHRSGSRVCEEDRADPRQGIGIGPEKGERGAKWLS
jgi:hypothetical protein